MTTLIKLWFVLFAAAIGSIIVLMIIDLWGLR